MSESLDLTIDVTEAAALGEAAHIALTVQLPDSDTLGAEPVVCFAKPGGGYSKEYFTLDLPGPARGAQSDWHAQRGWLFVAVDHLGVGASSTDHDGARLDYTTLAAASHAAEQEVLRRLAVFAWRQGWKVPKSELQAFLAEGFTLDHYELVQASIAASRSPARRNSTRQRGSIR